MHFVGGAERLVTDLALDLANDETMVELVTGVCHRFWRGEISRKADQIALKELGHAVPGNLSFWLNARRFAKAFSKLINIKTDVIVTSSFPASLVADSFAKSYDAEIVHYFHEAPMVLHDREGVKSLPLRLRVFYRLMSALHAGDDIEAVRRSSMILANSRLSQKINAGIYGLDESRTEVVYPGVNIEHVTPSRAEPRFISKYLMDGIPIIFFPKGTQFWWNPEICLQALKQLASRCFVAVFTGGAEYEVAALIKHAKALELAEKVFWIRELSNEELNAMYSQCSLVVSIPKRQPFGLIPLEALVCGAPPIISNSSGVSEVLRDGVEAICIDGDDLGELVDAIEMLVSDTENRNRILSNGRQKVLSEFTSSRFANEMREKLSKLAG
jgi:glycosyltransferase involved in cell wall biosynthesis